MQVMSAQDNPYNNKVLLAYLNKNNNYKSRRASIVKQLSGVQPGRWGEFVNGVEEDVADSGKVVAFTFDACGGNRIANGYNSKLIDFFRAEHVPATLFLTGLWIDANYRVFMKLATDTLFEIENHGLRHRPCSVNGNSKYGIIGTGNIFDAFDEIEANAEKIRLLTGRKPTIYRSATAYVDEASVKMANMIGTSVISYDILSGDAISNTPASTITRNVLEHLKPGAIIIMHMNHPENNTLEALSTLIPELRKRGYSFVKLQGQTLKSRINPKKK